MSGRTRRRDTLASEMPGVGCDEYSLTVHDGGRRQDAIHIGSI